MPLSNIRIERLSEKNFSDYELLTCKQEHGGCYCAFWHKKVQSMEEWEKCQRETPDQNRQMVYEKMRSGFHVGVLAYQDQDLLAWISIGPLTDFYWTWKRLIQVGEAAKTVAGITCFTVAPNFRGKGLQSKILEVLKSYGKSQGWSAIEGYPFDQSTLEKQKDKVIWPGVVKGFKNAGFTHEGPHWISGPEWERSIYKINLNT